MIKLREIDNENTALQLSPMICSAESLLSYLIKHDEIGLTKAKAFQRKFVHWAAANFEWPGFEEEKLFSVNKVLNEYDFPPLEMLHVVLLKLKLIRHYKGACKLTKAGKGLVGKRGELFGLIAPFYLFRVDHSAYSRFSEPVLGNWDVFLNIINVEAAHGISGSDLREVFYGPREEGDLYDHALGMLWSQVLRPLSWLGVFAEVQPEGTHGFEHRIFMKTPLWDAAFDLDTDHMLQEPLRH
jgi:hypothetical protein